MIIIIRLNFEKHTTGSDFMAKKFKLSLSDQVQASFVLNSEDSDFITQVSNESFHAEEKQNVLVTFNQIFKNVVLQVFANPHRSKLVWLWALL